MKNLGLVSVSFREYSPEQIIKAVKDAGLSCIEWGSDIHAPANDKERLKEIVKLQNEYKIFCSSYGTYIRLGKNSTEELKEYIDAAKLLGTDVLRVWCGEKASYNYSDEEKELFFAECKKAAQLAEENDVFLCMECHHGTFTETKEGADELMKAINSPNFLMYWQPNQFVSFEENIKYSKQISSYVKLIHVFNWEKNDKFPLFDGKDIWKKYLENLKDVDTLLLEFMPDGKIESLKTEASALIDIIEEMN